MIFFLDYIKMSNLKGIEKLKDLEIENLEGLQIEKKNRTCKRNSNRIPRKTRKTRTNYANYKHIVHKIISETLTY